MSSQREQVQIPEVFAACSEVGNVREHNEDSFLVQSPLFVVADGMGGHEAGEVASAIAVETMAAHAPDGPDAEALAQAVRLSNDAVLRGAEDGTGKPGMGTTLTAALVFGDEVVIAQVGDSRAYLLHAGSLQRITRDHSLVADLVEQGRITEEEARYHPQRSVITRALGSDPNMEPDTYRLRVEDGDLLMLCSDGLSSMVEDAAIEAVMLEHHDPQECCDALVAEALAAGGLDNVTVVVVDPFARAVTEEDLADRHVEEHPAPGATPASVPSQAAKEAREELRQEKRRAKEQRKGNKGRRAPLIWVIAFVVVIVGACAGFFAYAQNSYYLMAEDNHVTLYRGLPGQIAGLSFSWEEEEFDDVDVSKLAPTTAGRLERGISVDSKEAALELVDSYRQTISGTTPSTAPDATAAGTGA